VGSAASCSDPRVILKNGDLCIACASQLVLNLSRRNADNDTEAEGESSEFAARRRRLICPSIYRITYKDQTIMKRTFAAAVLFAALSMTSHAETRCGVITNSLPGGELTLDDRDAAWQLDASGVPDKMPDTHRGEQCGCVTGATDPKAHAFTSVTGGQLKPMKACNADTKLMQAFKARYHQ
jgi:Protein of unknown function (DUF4087)